MGPPALLLPRRLLQLLQLCAVASTAAAAPRAAATRPNIVLFLMDDQDMGGYEPMAQTKRLIADQGMTATNWFVATPVCCPSRGEFLTGRYLHNIKEEHLTHEGCMHIDEKKVNPDSFGAHLGGAGYTQGWFGKHLNNCPHHPPPGWDCPTCRWFANGGGSDFEPGGYLNASFSNFYGNAEVQDAYSHDGTYTASTAGEYAGYTTSIIANKSIEWLHKVAPLGAPWVAVVAPKASHFPATPAPWYLNGTVADGRTAPRTPNWNLTASQLAGHHSMIAQQGPISANEGDAIDAHFRNRWRTLLSADDAVAGVVEAVKALGQQAYFFITSDHGYNLGQLNLVSCKLNVYDHNIRVPFLFSGPGIAVGGTFSRPGSHVDIAATVLDLAGIQGVAVDGQSIAPLVVDPRHEGVALETRRALSRSLAASPNPAAAWRDFSYIEYLSVAVRFVPVCGKECSARDLSYPFYPSLVGMHCGSITLDPAPDTHIIDNAFDNTFRALRFLNSSAFGNLLYAEFTDLYTNYNWRHNDSISFVEIFDLDADPFQMHNLAASFDPVKKASLRQQIRALHACKGASCHRPAA